MPKKKCLCNTLGVETKKQTHHFPFNFLRAHDWWFSHQQTPFPDVISVNSHVRKPPRRASYDRQSLGISWFELGFKNKTLVASYINIIPPLPNSFRLHVVLECFRHTTSLFIRFTLSIYFFLSEFYYLFLITPNPATKNTKRLRSHRWVFRFPSSWHCQMTCLLRWRCVIGSPWSLIYRWWVFNKALPSNFKQKAHAPSQMGSVFFSSGGGTNVASFSPNVFPICFPNAVGVLKTTNIVSWNYQNCITSFDKSHPSGHQICLRFSPSLHSGYLRSDTNVRIDEAFQPQKHGRDILFFVKVIDLWVDISVTPQKKHVTSNRIGQLDIKYIFFCWGKKSMNTANLTATTGKMEGQNRPLINEEIILWQASWVVDEPKFCQVFIMSGRKSFTTWMSQEVSKRLVVGL